MEPVPTFPRDVSLPRVDMDGETRAVSAEELLGRLGWIRALAGRLVADPGAAEDLAQETLVASLGRPAPPRSWLARVLRSRARERRGSERSRAHRERAAARPEGVAPADEASLRLERQRLVVEAVQALGEPLRTTLVLRWFDERTPTEVAAHLSVPVGTVRWRLSRGLERLREELDRRHGGDRGAWVAALAPLAAPPFSTAPAAGIATWIGGIVGLKAWTLAASAVAAVGIAVWIGSGSAPTPADRGTRVPVATDELPDPRSPGDMADAAAAAARAAPPAAADRRAPAAAGGGPHLIGRVLWPAGLSADPELQVHALDQAVTYPVFAEAASRAPWDPDHRRWLEARRLAQATVAPDGIFVLSLPEGARRAHLMLQGRFLYLPQSVEVPVEVELGGEALLLEPSAGAHVSGRVLVPEGFDPGGVRIELEVETQLTPGGEAHQADLETDPQGFFAVGAVPAVGTATLLARPKRLAARLERLEALEPGQEVSLTLLLERGGGVRGRVVDGDGAAIPGARVEAQLGSGPFGSGGPEVRQAPCDPGGAFALEAVPSGALVLQARAPGWLESRRQDALVPTDGELDGVTIVLTRGRTVAGHVTWPDGTPAEGVVVEVGFDPAWRMGTTGFNALRGASGGGATDEGGRFRVTGLGAGPFVVLAMKSPEGTLVTHRARRDGVRPDGPPLELVLWPPLSLEGRVVNGLGRAVPAAGVRAVRTVEGELGPTASQVRSTRADAEGRFSLEGLEEGTWELAAEAGEAQSTVLSAESLTVDLPQRGSLELVVRSAATAAGRVVDREGRPLADATVRLHTGLTALQRANTGRSSAREARTDADGRFELGPLPPGERALEAEAPGLVASAPLQVSLPEGGRAEGLELVLGPGAVLTGEVWDEGRPAAGRMVQLVQFSAASYEALSERTDDRGRFRYGAVPPGTWVVLVLDPGRDLSAGEDGESLASVMRAMTYAQVVLEEGRPTHVVLGSPPIDPVQVHGHVRSAGEPLEMALSFYPGSGRVTTGAVNTVSEPDGSYRTSLPAPGAWIVAVQEVSADPDRQRILEYHREVPDGGAELDFDLPTGRVSGLVLGPGGAPAAGAPVLAVRAEAPRSDSLWGGQLAIQRTDARGHFEVRHLAAGPYLIAAGGAGLGHPATPRFGRASVTLQLAAGQVRDDLRLELPAPGAVRVLVRGPDGAPFPGATVFARGPDGMAVDGYSTVVSDGQGAALYPGLSPGEVTLSARAEGLAAADGAPVRVRAGATATAELRLTPATVLWVRMRGPLGPMPARLTVQDDRGRDVGGLFSRQDLEWLQSASEVDPAQVRLGPLPPGRYLLRASGDGGLAAEKRVTLGGEPEKRVALRLR